MFTMPNAVRDTERRLTRTPDLVPAVGIACRILDSLSRGEPAALTLTDLSRELGLAKSTLHNQLSTLQTYRLVDRDEATRRYRLGVALISLGLAAGRQLRAAALVAERLPGLAAEFGLTFAVVQVADPQEAVLVDCAYPAEDVHVGLTVGSRYGVFHGAIGKCLLAAMDPAEAARIVRDHGIPRYTESTVIDPQTFLSDLDRVRRDGWAASAGEFKENHAIAAPLFDPAGNLELVLFGVGFPGQLPVSSFATVGRALMMTARAVDRQHMSHANE